LRPGYELRPMLFSEDEALALILGLVLARRVGVGAAARIDGALAKIARVLPDRLRGRVQAVQGTLTFTPIRGVGRMADPDKLLTLSAAAQDNRRVWLRYRADDDETQRDIDHYGVGYPR